MKKKDLIYTISSYVTMTLSIVLGLLFIMQVIRIYDANNTPMFSRELVGKYILQILPCIILFVLSVIFIGVYAVIRNISIRNNVKPTNKDKFDNMMRLINKEDIKDNKLLKRETILRKVMIIGNIVVASISLLICLYYLLFVKKFELLEEISPQVVDAFVHFLPWIGISLVYSLINIYVCDFSYARSIEILKQIDCKKNKVTYTPSKYESIILWSVRGVIVVLAIVLIVVGATKNGYQSVFDKAANLCTECVGLG